MDGILKECLSYGFGGLILATNVLLFRYLLKTSLPNLVKDFREELAAERQAHREDRAELLAAINEHGCRLQKKE